MSQHILRTSAVEIADWFQADPLDAKVFARVLYLARRVEEIACAEGRADEIAVKTKALEALEGKAPLTHAAIRDDLFSGSPTLRAKHISLEEASASLRQQVEGVRALPSGNGGGGTALALPSGDRDGYDDRNRQVDRPAPLKGYIEELEEEHAESKKAPRSF